MTDKELLDEAMNLISKAAPLAWIYNEPNGVYLEFASQWEKEAEKLLNKYKEGK